eukprot:scaffold8538_cov92-Skeletonema_marinoi.AAC.3
MNAREIKEVGTRAEHMSKRCYAIISRSEEALFISAEILKRSQSSQNKKMRPQAKKFVSPLLFLALVVISIVVVSQLIGRNDSSMLTIDNDEPPITDDENNDDDGLRT